MNRSKTPLLVRDPRDWQRRCLEARERGAAIALVPTMGFLHDGHVSLMREARARADALAAARPAGGGEALAVASIFVNPSQFGPTEDLARYPRDLEGDLAKCAAAGIDAVLAPDAAAVYGARHQTWVDVTGVSQGLCGGSRPGHFRGVATVVAKLFNLTRPHVALFGEKDFQQLAVIRAMARDLDMAVDVVGMPIVREPDGVAMSSRNAYLSPDDRRRAVALSRALVDARDRVTSGERDAAALIAAAKETLAAAGARVDYVEIVDPETLAPVQRAAPGSRMLVAAHVGATRLIDNAALP
ncbi:MAG TPA: pantoate--beta-alanine ligase [Anaeromyxobacteraceae bacterium]|nr:pantoate--beta-alanine ligase [Anaeromyxobacteraceae bacterium]